MESQIIWHFVLSVAAIMSCLWIQSASPSTTPCTNCDGNNATRCVNVTSSGECLQCRDSRFYGKQCEHDCPDTCLNSRCKMDNTRVVCTEGCVAGKKGDNCGVNCPTACRQCERYGDGCTGPCQNPWYYGQQCRTPCPAFCTGGCNRITGDCGSCEPGYTGGRCDVTCPPNCRDGCDKDTGERGSCEPGYTGAKCAECASLGAYIGTTCVVLAAIIILVVIVYKRRLGGREKHQAGTLRTPGALRTPGTLGTPATPGTLGTPDSTYTLCSVNHLVGHLCDELSGDTSMECMLGEFQKLSSPYLQPVTCASLDENKEKNRYKDILPFDATRVTLEIEQEDDSDYINASYLDGYMDTVRYVAAQGPLEQTTSDFWRMTWQLNTNKIVMLTNLMEMGRVKCHRYWPDSMTGSTMYGCVRVQFREEEVHESHTVRSLAVYKEGRETRLIQQFHFTQWPDHGVPGDTAALLHFYKVVKESRPPLTGPIVVHCSAGVGRTGTFLALDYLLEQARNEGRVCVYNCVQHFRMKRMKMVQTREQYVFIHNILKDAFQSALTVKKPVHIQCEACWYRTEKHSDEEDVLYENVPRHWPHHQQHGDGDAASLPDVCDGVCDVVCETMPLLTDDTDDTAEGRLPEVRMDEEAGRVSWISP